MIHLVVFSRNAQAGLRSAPRHVAAKLLYWLNEVERNGLEETRKHPGFYDELLKGCRKGQRSIRSSRACRAIYEIRGDGAVALVRVEEVTKHQY